MTEPPTKPPKLDERIARLFDDQEPASLGNGWISGTASVFLGLLSVGGVACLHFPDVLTWPGLREVYALSWIRPLVATVIGGAFLLGLLSALLRRRKVLGLTGMGLALLASLAGGASVPVESAPSTAYGLGLDWFLLNLLLVALVFVPMERLFPQWPAQSTFRIGWTTDLIHFFVSHLLVQVSAWLTLAPAAAATRVLLWPDVQATVAALPGIVQVAAIVLVADLGEYTMHRAFHRVPWLWRFHAIHHSSEHIDWLAGSRLHLVDVVLTRGFTFVPIALLGFANGPVYAYLVFVSFHAVFIHANVRFRFGAAEHWIVTPRFHHWHHSAQPEAWDKNFAVHLPWIDKLFGTYHLPKDQWPSEYGLGLDHIPNSYSSHLTWPFRRK
ncbi:MAG: sterol desaturase family protein [Acidobacteria bacterium]|nr:sterol desaturase family protein [Acidobacteriota bacterium]